MRAPGPIAVVWCTLATSACFTSNVLVTIRPDGSGRVQQTILLRPVAIAQFEKLTASDPADRMTPERIWAEIQKRSGDMRLRFGTLNRRVTPVNTGEAIGATVSYDFGDVGIVDLDLLPELVGGSAFWRMSSPDHGASTKLRMSLEPIADGLERLNVHFPNFRLDPSLEPPAAWASGSPAEMVALKEVMKDARIVIVLTTEAPLVRTNSPFREENRVTLLDADLGEALFSKEVQRLVTTAGSFDELLSWYADLPGITLAHERDITLDFQNPSAQPSGVPGTRSPSSPSAQDTDIFLATLSHAGGTLGVGPPINITDSPGYDNQPSFSPDGANILFSSERGGALPARDSTGKRPSSIPQTDIFEYSIASRNMRRVTLTPDSEFSPTVMPDGVRVSMIRVEADGTQRLCSADPSGGPKRETAVILPDVKPVGYHVWIDGRKVVLYVLGRQGQPATLQIADVQTGETRIVAADVGRSLQRTPSGAISFVQHDAAADGGVTAMIKELDPRTLETRPLVRPAGGITDPYIAWLPDGTSLMAVDSTLYRWRAGDPDWTAVAHLGGFGLHDVSRIAVSPNGDRLAIVARK